MANIALNHGACSNSTRGLHIGGTPNNGAGINVIGYMTIATLGNASDFGDTSSLCAQTCATSSPTRAVIALGKLSPSDSLVNTLEYVQIATTGNSTDFGDLLIAADGRKAASNAHGGL